MTQHIVLLGDSIFDNKSYVGREPDVSEHLRTLLPEQWQVTLCALDGTTTTDIGRQFDQLPKSASHIVMSLGGNDALANADLLESPVTSTGEALDIFQNRLDEFERFYGYVLEGLCELGKPVTVCTIYNGNLSPLEAIRARIGLMLFNDVIVRSALKHGMNIIELRSICTDPGDYANPIEPSSIGGLKIARAVAVSIGVLENDDFSRVALLGVQKY